MRKKNKESNNIRNEASLFLEKTKLRALPLLLNLFPELFQFLLLGIMLLLSFPYVLYVPKTPRVPSLLVQKLQRHRSSILIADFSEVWICKFCCFYFHLLSFSPTLLLVGRLSNYVAFHMIVSLLFIFIIIMETKFFFNVFSYNL